MPQALTLIGTAQGGWISLDEGQRSLLRSFCRDRDGKPVHLTLSEPKRPRSNEQNALYWMWLDLISGETGYSPNELHAVFKKLYLTPRLVPFGGMQVEITTSTTELTTSQFTEYLDRINAFASTDLGLSLPQPESL